MYGEGSGMEAARLQMSSQSRGTPADSGTTKSSRRWTLTPSAESTPRSPGNGKRIELSFCRRRSEKHQPVISPDSADHRIQGREMAWTVAAECKQTVSNAVQATDEYSLRLSTVCCQLQRRIQKVMVVEAEPDREQRWAKRTGSHHRSPVMLLHISSVCKPHLPFKQAPGSSYNQRDPVSSISPAIHGELFTSARGEHIFFQKQSWNSPCKKPLSASNPPRAARDRLLNQTFGSLVQRENQKSEEKLI